jgi:hypothetical protein
MEALKNEAGELGKSFYVYLTYISEFVETPEYYTEEEIEEGEDLLKRFKDLLEQMKFQKSDGYMKKEAERLYLFLQDENISFKDMSDKDLIEFCKERGIDQVFLTYSDLKESWNEWSESDPIVVSIIKQVKKMFEGEES